MLVLCSADCNECRTDHLDGNCPIVGKLQFLPDTLVSYTLYVELLANAHNKYNNNGFRVCFGVERRHRGPYDK